MQSILLHRTIQTQNFRIALKQLRPLLFITLSLISFVLAGQDRCGTKTPDTGVFENWLQTKIQEKAARGKADDVLATVYEIPVVVHIIEPLGGSLNITDERIIRQVEILNEDFRRTNADASNTPAEFLPVAADTEIQFVLAKQDPSGNPTNGIVRVQGSKSTYFAELDQDLLRSESFWPPDHYLNIYVLNLQVFLGYASFPISDIPGITNVSGDYIWDGVEVHYRYFGENPDAPSFPSVGRTLTHEIGHYLGLRHIWGDGGCSVDDFVTDTPPADDDNGGLSSPCTFPSNDSNVCVTDEMFQNYMDYTDDGCMNLFTEGQKTRMRTILESSPRRTTLLTSPGLIEPTRFSNDLAINRIVTPLAVCESTMSPSVEVINHGDNVISSYDVSLFIDGTPIQTINQSSTLEIDESETLVFSSQIFTSTPSSIEFRVDNVNGGADGNSANDILSISLSQSNAISLPFSEDFESSLNILGNTGDAYPWEVVTAPSENPANKALKFKSFGNTTAFGEDTWIKTPIFDLSGINSSILTYRYAYAEATDTFWDGLAVKMSLDCGETFSDDFIFNEYGPNLSTATLTNDPFTPQSELDWQVDTVTLAKSIVTDGVQFAFVGQNGAGNNIYIDDITIIQTNTNANDISILEVESSMLTCRNSTSADFRIRNVGFEDITSLKYQYTLDGITQEATASNLSIIAGDFSTISFDVDLENGSNQFSLTITEVNGSTDDDLTNNTAVFNIDRSTSGEAYPLLVDFEIPNNWSELPDEESQIWNKTLVNGNWSLFADAFNATELGKESWFISPNLSIGTLDSAGLSFKVSYANRPGFTDRLQVLMSINCGENYTFELLNASSDSLAITESLSAWAPQSDSDWKEFRLDLKPSIVWQDDIRIAFVFTNGNGNNLYLDDINIGIQPETVTVNDFLLFPNPATSYFNVAFELSRRDDVNIQIMDMSGRVILNQTYDNILDQVINFNTISEEGFYFVKITGNQINKTERLYIRR